MLTILTHRELSGSALYSEIHIQKRCVIELNLGAVTESLLRSASNKYTQHLRLKYAFIHYLKPLLGIILFNN